MDPTFSPVPTKPSRDKSKAALLEEIAALRGEITRLHALAEGGMDVQEWLQRLATFPEENPNPVIAMDFSGATTYLNPAAQQRFPELWQLGSGHPLMRDLPFPYEAASDANPAPIVREIQVGEAVYEQKVCYMGRDHGSHIRIYVHDITRRKRAEETNQDLIKRLVRAHEEERQRVSRELHDEAGQALTALKLSLELIKRDIAPDASGVRDNLAEAIRLTEATKEQIRMLARGLRPPALDAVGLNLTLESFCRDFARRTRLAIDYRGSDVSGLSDPANMCLYRTLQEALTNVARHARATRVEVQLVHDEDRVRLVVEDNGKGMPSRGRRPSSNAPNGIGLIGLQERLALLGGGLAIEAAQRGGLRLAAELPMRGPV